MYEPVRDVVGPKWSLEILNLLSEEGSSGWINYIEIESAVEETSSDVVSDRLSVLQEYNLIDRDEKSSKDVRYSITAKGELVLSHADKINSTISQYSSTSE
jgi:DNA-binding HxlR family transcriptional regulator